MITSIGAKPTFRKLMRMTPKTTYSRPSSPVVRSIRRVRPASRPYERRFMRTMVPPGLPALPSALTLL